MIEKWEGTPLLYGGLAAAQMQLGNFKSAQQTLQTSINECGPDPDTLINCITCANHMKLNTSELEKMLQEAAPGHPYIENNHKLRDLFEGNAKQYVK